MLGHKDVVKLIRIDIRSKERTKGGPEGAIAPAGACYILSQMVKNYIFRYFLVFKVP